MTLLKTDIRRGVSNEGGFFSPYYLYELLDRQHHDELDSAGRDANQNVLPRFFRNAQRRFSETGSTPGQARDAWYTELFTALGFIGRENNIRRLDEKVATRRYGAVPISHGAYLDENDGIPLVYVDLHGFGTDIDRDTYEQDRRFENTRDPIARAIEFALDFNETRWALVAAGTKLRLYRKGGSVARQYLEVDFPALFDANRTDEWTAFWGLFRFEAFIPDEDGKCLLDRVLEESQRHATRIADDLRENILVALEALVQGALDDPANQHLLNYGRPDEKTLQQLFEEALYFLYRLLFVLYAESRDLLPIAESLVYRDTYSFEHLRDIADRDLPDADQDRTYFMDTLRILMSMLYHGFPDGEPFREHVSGETGFVIPPYNGQLFSPKRTALLDQCRITDRYMHTVIREMSLSRPRRRADRRERFSYADLGVDQLGSIYEGLLVYEPAIAEEDIVLANVGNDERWVTFDQAEEYALEWSEQRHRGSFYLRLWGGRRKSSASYYTPQEITSFLVKEALEPLVEPIIEGCSERDTNDRPLRKPDEILELRVCDPAMGSGAFLIQACRYLAEAYGRARIAAGEDDDGRVSQEEFARYKRRVAERCLYGVDLQPMAVELTKVSLWLETLASGRPLEFLDTNLRQGNSLIGAPLRDTNSNLSVDLILTIPDRAFTESSKEATKELKDEANQRKKRNRAEIKEVEKQTKTGQSGLWDVFNARELNALVKQMLEMRHQLETSDLDLTISEALKLIYEKEENYQRIYSDEDSPYATIRRICDLWCSIWFWPHDAEIEPPTTAIYRELVAYLIGDSEACSLEISEIQPYLETVVRVLEEMSFFHWEIEFPEIWQSTGKSQSMRSGFDVMVGNPPWDQVKFDNVEFFSQWNSLFSIIDDQNETKALLLDRDEHISQQYYRTVQLTSQISNFLRYSPVYAAQIGGRSPDLYRAFCERNVQLCQTGGFAALVLPEGVYALDGSSALRQLLIDHTKIELLISIENRHKIFPIDGRRKVVLLYCSKGGTSDEIPARYFIHPGFVPSLSELAFTLVEAKLDPISIRVADLKEYSPKSLVFREFQTQRDANIYGGIYRSAVSLSKITDAKYFSQSQSFNRSEFWDFLNEDGVGVPGITGRCIHQYDINYSPYAWWVQEQSIPRMGRLEWTMQQPIVAFRITARSTDEWTLIGSIVPPTIATDYKLNLLVPENDNIIWVPWLAAWINSFIANYAIRQFHASTDISQSTMKQLPLIAFDNTDERHIQASKLALSLSSHSEDFADLWDTVAPVLELPPWQQRDLPNNLYERAVYRAKIDAYMAGIFEVSTEDYAYILNTFRLDRNMPPLIEEPLSTVTRDIALWALCQQRNMSPPDDIVAFFAGAGVDVSNITGPIRKLEDRVNEATKLGAIAYIPSGSDEEIETDSAPTDALALFDED